MRIAIGSEPRLLNILRAVVKFHAQEAGLSKSDAEYVALAIDEAAANVIRHTYCGCHDKLGQRSIPLQMAGSHDKRTTLTPKIVSVYRHRRLTATHNRR